MESQTRLERVVYKTTVMCTAAVIYGMALFLLDVVVAALWEFLYLIGR